MQHRASFRAAEIIADFRGVIRRKALADVYPCWKSQAELGGDLRERDIHRAAVTSGWSNGPREGQPPKLKLVKRQMHGRGKRDLLQTRVIGVAQRRLYICAEKAPRRSGDNDQMV
jgi:transposase